MASPTTNSTRLSPSQPYRNSFSYRRFSNTRVSDARGSRGEEDADDTGRTRADEDGDDDMDDDIIRGGDSSISRGRRLDFLMRGRAIEEEAIEEDPAPTQARAPPSSASASTSRKDREEEKDELDSTATATPAPEASGARRESGEAAGAASPALSVLTDLPDDVKPAAAAAAAPARGKRARRKKADDDEGSSAKKRKGAL